MGKNTKAQVKGEPIVPNLRAIPKKERQKKRRELLELTRFREFFYLTKIAVIAPTKLFWFPRFLPDLISSLLQLLKKPPFKSGFPKVAACKRVEPTVKHDSYFSCDAFQIPGALSPVQIGRKSFFLLGDSASLVTEIACLLTCLS